MIDSAEPTAALSVPETARFLGISRRLVYDGIARGDLPSIRVGRRVLVPRPALDAMLAAAPASRALEKATLVPA